MWDGGCLNTGVPLRASSGDAKGSGLENRLSDSANESIPGAAPSLDRWNLAVPTEFGILNGLAPDCKAPPAVAGLRVSLDEGLTKSLEMAGRLSVVENDDPLAVENDELENEPI